MSSPIVDAWIRLAAERVHLAAAQLTLLDQAIGDGDHGTNLDRGFSALLAMVDAGAPEGEGRAAASERLRQAGRALISSVGGASGPLYGTGLLRSAATVGAADAGATPGALLVAALDAAVAGIGTLGRSTTGEKTMLDALAPAAEAARAALEDGQGDGAIARAAATAAELGAAATIPMLATKGRASYLGPRSIGHQDPGATSAALLVRALADVISG